jgi:hypothetical protein
MCASIFSPEGILASHPRRVLRAHWGVVSGRSETSELTVGSLDEEKFDRAMVEVSDTLGVAVPRDSAFW